MKTAAELREVSEKNSATLTARISEGVMGIATALEEKAARGLRVASFELTEEFSELVFAKMLADSLSQLGYTVSVDKDRVFNGQKLVRSFTVEW